MRWGWKIQRLDSIVRPQLVGRDIPAVRGEDLVSGGASNLGTVREPKLHDLVETRNHECFGTRDLERFGRRVHVRCIVGVDAEALAATSSVDERCEADQTLVGVD